MDHLAPAVSNPQRRRRYTNEFKSRVVQSCNEPGQSVAGVARRHDLNANLLHKWRKRFKAGPTDFIQLPVPVMLDNKSTGSTIRIDLPGGLVVQWPMDRLPELVN
jgi:transposase